MITLDSSAIIAIEFREPGYEKLIERISTSGRVIVGAPTLFESSQVLERKAKMEAWPRMSDFCASNGIEVVPFTVGHARVAHKAFTAYGKGRHPAGLNLGDCMSYAISKVEDAPLLFVGQDFALTDITAA